MGRGASGREEKKRLRKMSVTFKGWRLIAQFSALIAFWMP